MENRKRKQIICHPEFISGSVHCGIERNLSKHTNGKTLKLVQGDTRLFGFTLAEVLITLGIIGVVAALTIPTLVTNYQTRAWDTAAKVFEQQLEEGLKVMNTQQVLAGYKTTEKFVEELQKHVSITKVCSNDDILSCFEDKVFWGTNEEEVDMSTVKIPANLGQKGWGTNLLGVQFANGVLAILGYNPACKQDPYSNRITGLDCIAMLYDVSGYSNPNTSGKDLRNINVKSLNNVCAFEINNTCYTTPKIAPATAMTFDECAGENKDDSITPTGGQYPTISAGKEAAALGIKTCRFLNDYWAGAVRECGGVDKLPTMAQLAEIANYIYNTNNASATSSDLKKDTSRATALGFPDSDFGIFSSEERGDGYLVTSRWYSENQSEISYFGRPYKFNNRFLICVGE